MIKKGEIGRAPVAQAGERAEACERQGSVTWERTFGREQRAEVRG